jgi:CRP-like cAMP-binding protein
VADFNIFIPMVENLITYLQDKIVITDAEVAIIKSVCRVKKLRRRQYLLQEGDMWRYNAFVSSGLVRTYRVDDKGQEHIIQFSAENWWCGDRYSYVYEAPARSNIDALEDSEVLLISKADFEMLYRAIPNLSIFMLNLVERSFIALQDRIHAGISLSAEEKYNDFVKTYPSILSRVPQHMIASFLGLTPETLSRIRAKK